MSEIHISFRVKVRFDLGLQTCASSAQTVCGRGAFSHARCTGGLEIGDAAYIGYPLILIRASGVCGVWNINVWGACARKTLQ